MNFSFDLRGAYTWQRELVGSVLLGGAFFRVFLGFSILDPHNIAWLMEGDWAQAYLGWAFYKDASWSFPFGAIPDFFFPFGTYVAYTDSNPLFATIVKLLFGWIMPDYPIQIFGFWLLLCFILHAHFSNLILLEYEVNNIIYRIIAIIIVLCSPVLLLRTGHLTLCAQWLILFCIWNYIRKGKMMTLLITQSFILFLAASTHPYLLLIVFGFSVAFLVKHIFYTKEITFGYAIYVIAMQLLLVIATCYSFGYFSIRSSNMVDLNYGNFAANLNCLYNSMGSSWFIEAFPVFHDQPAEGMGYLGLGILIMILVLVFARPRFVFRNFDYTNGNFPLFILAILFFLFALSTRIVWGDRIFLEFKHLVLVEKLGSIFRYSARFIWVAHYLILFISLIAYYKWIRKELYAVGLLLAFGLVQLVDLHDMFLYRASTFKKASGKYSFEGDDSLAIYVQNVSRIVTYPAFDRTIVKNDDYIDFSFMAAVNNKPITAGYLARFDGEKAERYRNEVLPDSIRKGQLNNSLYVTNDEHLYDFFDALLSGKAFWVKKPPYNYIFSSENKLVKSQLEVGRYIKYDKGKDFLERHRDLIVIISSKDEAVTHLSEEIKTYLTNIGSRINNLQFRGSYFSVIKNDRILLEEINNHGEAHVVLPVDYELESYRLPKALEVRGAGKDFGDISIIAVDNIDLSANGRGLNMVALDRDLNLVESVNVDTHRSSDWVRFVQNNKLQ